MTDCFGFILAGGASEVSIGLELENANHSLDLKRDELESTVVAHARESGKPLFCICRGMQLLNATLGGSNGVLNQDQLERHRRLDTPFQTTVHAVKLVTGSSTRRILGAPIVQVNSAHGFAVSRVAENARITAFSDDCVAEGIEVPSDFWTVGVQWHPESLLADPRQLALFENFADHILEASSSR
jgi:putative glutamine amidotransferase